MEQKNIAAALVKAQRAFGPALKDKTNPHFRSKYADLGACIDAVMDALNAAGIALIQRQHPQEGGVCIETVFIHESGEQISAGMLTVPAAKQDPQGYGSAITYARRYSLMAACGIAPEDDDGNSASKPKSGKPVFDDYETRQKHDIPPAVDLSPKARAQRIMTGVAAGDAAGAALALSQMDEKLYLAIWKEIDGPYQDKLIAAWPKVAE